MATSTIRRGGSRGDRRPAQVCGVEITPVALITWRKEGANITSTSRDYTRFECRLVNREALVGGTTLHPLARNSAPKPFWPIV